MMVFIRAEIIVLIIIRNYISDSQDLVLRGPQLPRDIRIDGLRYTTHMYERNNKIIRYKNSKVCHYTVIEIYYIFSCFKHE